MNLGEAFLMAVPPNYNLKHLFIVISDPACHGGTCVAVNVTGTYYVPEGNVSYKKGIIPG